MSKNLFITTWLVISAVAAISNRAIANDSLRQASTIGPVFSVTFTQAHTATNFDNLSSQKTNLKQAAIKRFQNNVAIFNQQKHALPAFFAQSTKNPLLQLVSVDIVWKKPVKQRFVLLKYEVKTVKPALLKKAVYHPAPKMKPGFILASYTPSF